MIEDMILFMLLSTNAEFTIIIILNWSLKTYYLLDECYFNLSLKLACLFDNLKKFYFIFIV